MADAFSSRAWELAGMGRHAPVALGTWSVEHLASAHIFLFARHRDIPEDIIRFGGQMVRDGIFRLPFQFTIMEFKTNNNETVERIVLLCEQVELGQGTVDDNGSPIPPILILVYPVLRKWNGEWVWPPKPEPILIGSGERSGGESDAHKVKWNPDVYSGFWETVAAHAGALCPAGTVILMSRSSKLTTIEISERLQKSRSIAKNLPLYRFTVVEVPASVPSRSQATGLLRASPCLHWRRGHYRTLSSGRRKPVVIPVAPCLVGLADNGIVEKVYDARSGNGNSR